MTQIHWHFRLRACLKSRLLHILPKTALRPDMFMDTIYSDCSFLWSQDYEQLEKHPVQSVTIKSYCMSIRSPWISIWYTDVLTVFLKFRMWLSYDESGLTSMHTTIPNCRKTNSISTTCMDQFIFHWPWHTLMLVLTH